MSNTPVKTFKEQLAETTNSVLKYIGDYLLSREDIANKLDNPKKTLDECFRYIAGEASKQQQGGCACIDDETVFGWAVHYYDEDNIEITKVNLSAAKASKKQEEPVKEEIKSDEPLKKKPIKKAVADEQMQLF